MLPFCIAAAVSRDCQEDACGPSLEDLARKFGTDKARDDHSYVSVYAMLFDPIRHRVQNVTEVGVLYGKSMPVWHGYFPFAHLWAIDFKLTPHATQWALELQKKDNRVHYLEASSQDVTTPSRLGLAPSSMDIVIDDGDHKPAGNVKTLEVFWPLVKPGGYYIIEDIVTGGNKIGHYSTRAGPLDPTGSAWMAHNGTHWPASVRNIYEQNDVFFADTLVGHRDFNGFHSRMQGWMKNRVDHNSHLLVIKKRATPRSDSIQMNFHKSKHG